MGAAAIFAAAIHAQESRATLSGAVTDPSGSVIPAAEVSLQNSQTGVVFKTVTNEAGQYRFLFLNPGTYRLTVQSSGFRSFVRENIQLQVNTAPVVDVPMQIGDLADRVTVTSEAPLLEAEKGDRGLVINNKSVTELPLQGSRNPLTVAVLTPGAVFTAGSLANQPVHSLDGESSWSINGSRTKQVEFVLDGAPNNTVRTLGNNVAFVPPADAVEEINIMSNMFDAQYGRTAGGVVNMSIRGGTNDWHGTGYNFLKREWLNANSFSNNAQRLPRLGAVLDQRGFSFGGPVRIPRIYNGKDRTFFFVSYENSYQGDYITGDSLGSVPTPEQRKGDFSKTFDNAGRLFTIYDPLTGHFEGTRWVRNPFAGNVIAPNRFSPIGAKLLNLYPEPNTTTSGSVPWQNNYIAGDNIRNWRLNSVIARLDHNIGPRLRLMGRWAWNDFVQLTNNNGLPGVAGNYRYGSKANKKNIVLDAVATLTPSTILNLRGSLNHWVGDFKPYVPFDSLGFGFPASLVAQLPRPDAFPQIAIEGATTMGQSSGNSDYEGSNIISVVPNIVLIRGKHTIKAGLDFRQTRNALIQLGSAAGSYSFTRTFTRADYLVQDLLSGVAAASVLLGEPSSGSIATIDPPALQWLYYAPWVQDDFKVTRRLTVNLGLRWDMNLGLTERYNRLNYGFNTEAVNPISAQIDKTKFPGYTVKGGLGFVGVDGNPRSPVATDWNNIQFRIGAAYRLNDKTVVRGGYGTFYQNPTFFGNQFGFSQTTSYVSSLDSNRTSANKIDNPFPDGLIPPSGASLGMRTYLGQAPNFINPQYTIPYVRQFSFGFQRQLPFNMLADVSYVGSRSLEQSLTRGFNAIPVEAMNLGNPALGGDPNYLNALVPNPFAGLIPGTALNNATIARSQLLRPFPQFNNFSMQQVNTGRLWYNALQVSLTKRYSHGLTFTASYTLSKNLEDEYLNDQDAKPTRTLTAFDTPHRLAIGPSYELPFGKGRKYLSGAHPVVRGIAGGWQLTVTATFQSGAPMSIPNTVYLIGDPRLENPTWDRMFKTGVIDTNGAVRNVAAGESPVFAIRPTNSLRTTPARYGNLRNLRDQSIDASLIRNVRFRERWNLQLRVDTFNTFNHPSFSGNPNQTPTNVNFGKILRDSGQNNTPRIVQLGARIVF